MRRSASRSFPNAGSLNGPSPGSIAAAGSPRIGNASIARRSRSCASPPFGSCSESYAIRPKLSGQTLKAQEKAADEYNEEEKAQRLVDLSSAQHQLLNSELETVVGKFLPYMRFRNL